jgi:hypothetical protein
MTNMQPAGQTATDQPCARHTAADAGEAYWFCSTGASAIRPHSAHEPS